MLEYVDRGVMILCTDETWLDVEYSTDPRSGSLRYKLYLRRFLHFQLDVRPIDQQRLYIQHTVMASSKSRPGWVISDLMDVIGLGKLLWTKIDQADAIR
jgi:hypothetical protein